MRSSENYNLRLVEGSDLVNPLIQDVPNYEKIDEVMKDNEMASIGEAVELVSATVHAITRTWKTTSMFKFTATANFTAGETFTVDGLQVTALLPSGEPLASNCYITGSEVLCHLNSATNLMTVFVSGGTVTLAQDSERLGGQLPAYYATKAEVEQAQATATASGVLAQSAQSAVTALEAKIGTYSSEETVIGTWIDGKSIYRKVYSAKNVSLSGNTIIDPNFDLDYIDTLITMKLNALVSGAWRECPIRFVDNATRDCRLEIYTNGLSIVIANNTVTEYSVIIEYTK